MLHDHLKRLRSQKGLSQEAAAQQLHVVRQTVSKWEKGLSVPDADMLRKIADLYGVRVSELLDETNGKTMDELSIQLASLNAQLRNRERRLRSFLKYGSISLLILLGVWLVIRYGTGLPTPTAHQETYLRFTCTLEETTYIYSLSHDQNGKVYAYGGDPWFHENVIKPRFEYSPIDTTDSQADVWIAFIEDYFHQRGGRVEIEQVDPAYRPSPEFPVYAEYQ